MQPTRVGRRTGPKRWPWTREAYYRLAEQGFFGQRRVELIDGEIIEMPPMKSPHAMAIGLIDAALGKAFGAGTWIRTQLPLHLGPRSEPEPDAAAVPGEPRDYADHPTTALLVVEVSETTLKFDRARKGALYAAAKIADYWIVNLIDRRLEVYRDPQPDPARPKRFLYQQATILQPHETVTPLAAPHAVIKVADLLP
jgi:Uma2 family endonuclease